MEVDEGLDVARLDLHDAPCHGGEQQHLHPEGRGDHRAACRGVGAAGEHVQQITQPHEGEDAAVTGEHLGQQLQVEIVGDLMQHQLHGAHRIGAEEQPAEADQVESHEDTG